MGGVYCIGVCRELCFNALIDVPYVRIVCIYVQCSYECFIEYLFLFSIFLCVYAGLYLFVAVWRDGDVPQNCRRAPYTLFVGTIRPALFARLFPLRRNGGKQRCEAWRKVGFSKRLERLEDMDSVERVCERVLKSMCVMGI